MFFFEASGRHSRTILRRGTMTLLRHHRTDEVVAATVAVATRISTSDGKLPNSWFGKNKRDLERRATYGRKNGTGLTGESS